MEAIGTLQREVSEHAACAPSLVQFRRRVLASVARHIDYQAALFHELSPRASLERAASIGFEAGVLAESIRRWDDNAVVLGRLRDVALERSGVATDADAFPPGSRGRGEWVERVNRAFGVRATLAAHLVVRDRIVSVLLLFRRTGVAFGAQECDLIRRLVPTLAVGDALQQALAGHRDAGAPTHLRCVDQRLTPRQRDLVERVALGHTNVEIGQGLALSPNTVRNLLTAARARLGAANRAELVRLAVLR